MYLSVHVSVPVSVSVSVPVSVPVSVSVSVSVSLCKMMVWRYWYLTLGLWQHEEDASKLQLVHSRQVHELQELVC